MKRGFLAAAMVAAPLVIASTAAADIAYPARLDVAETEPGLYDITFTLPIIEGRKLRAAPVLPPTCAEASPRDAGLSAGGLTSTWSIRCEPASLAGEAILVEGLLGTQTDLALTLTTLDGRKFARILRPSRPGFLVPDPPAPWGLSVAAAVEGVRRTLRHVSLWLLLVMAALFGGRPGDGVKAAAGFAVGHLAAQWLGVRGWLEIAPQTRDLLTWASVAVPAVQFAENGESTRGWLRPLWPTTLLLGLVFGAALPEALPPEGLSYVEQRVALLLFGCGVGAAMTLIAAVAGEIRAILALAGGGRWRDPATRICAYVVGALATGMVLSRLAGWAMTTGNAPRGPLELVLLATVLGPTLAVAGRTPGPLLPLFVALAAVGVTPGLLHIPLPAASLLVLGSLCVLGGALALNRPLSDGRAAAVAAVAVVAGCWSAALSLVENVSRATAVTMGVVVVAVCVFYAALAMARDLRSGSLSLPVRLLGIGVVGLAVVWRVGEYRVWFDREVATEAALGLARVPVVALALAVTALVLRPRRRRVVRELGLDREAGAWHWMVLGAALLVVPYGTITVPNPFFTPHAPRGDDARRVVSRVLNDTYHAFNLADEEELYDTLAASVTGDLVDDLYLDGRRRLTAGTREGTRVTVRDVGVLEIGEPFGGADAEEGFSYDCRWAVVARVQHLQHVHHRQNLYNGVLTLKSDGGRWKISGVELLSEDRVVVPWKPTS